MSPNELKLGDRVRVTFEGEVAAEYIRMSVSALTRAFVEQNAISIERLPPKAEPLRVGEEITHFRTGIGAFNQDGRVLFVDGDYVGLKSGSHRWFAEIKDCKRRNNIPITTHPLED